MAFPDPCLHESKFSRGKSSQNLPKTLMTSHELTKWTAGPSHCQDTQNKGGNKIFCSWDISNTFLQRCWENHKYFLAINDKKLLLYLSSFPEADLNGGKPCQHQLALKLSSEKKVDPVLILTFQIQEQCIKHTSKLKPLLFSKCIPLITWFTLKLQRTELFLPRQIYKYFLASM